jgi:tRNA A37 threonylcarbamoyladenosine modification protein TsaB
MTLYIDTTKINIINISISSDGSILAEKKVITKHPSSERILVEIKKLLDSKNIKLDKITKIEVENRGESFTGLRMGVAIANAFKYALSINSNAIKFNIIKPIYNREPNIT